MKEKFRKLKEGEVYYIKAYIPSMKNKRVYYEYTDKRKFVEVLKIFKYNDELQLEGYGVFNRDSGEYGN